MSASLSDDLDKLLQSMTPRQIEGVLEILDCIERLRWHLDPIHDPRPRLPEEPSEALQEWLTSGKDISSFFAAHPELGCRDGWSLHEFGG